MSEYTPQLGDRVRVVLEGRVTYSGGIGDLIDVGGVHTIDLKAPDVVSVERLSDPLPTTPGSVIKRTNGNLTLLVDGVWWMDRAGVGIKAQHIDPGWTLIFDAGATS